MFKLGIDDNSVNPALNAEFHWDFSIDLLTCVGKYINCCAFLCHVTFYFYERAPCPNGALGTQDSTYEVLNSTFSLALLRGDHLSPQIFLQIIWTVVQFQISGRGFIKSRICTLFFRVPNVFCKFQKQYPIDTGWIPLPLFSVLVVNFVVSLSLRYILSYLILLIYNRSEILILNEVKDFELFMVQKINSLLY